VEGPLTTRKLQLLFFFKALRAPTPGEVYDGKDKITPSFQIETFFGFFLTAKLHDSLAFELRFGLEKCEI
jgi:hypothetical protein